ncbi:hypothetical protein HK098_007291 [Nowakowskiella sp. JEL0407]|nr:hypothetical protein HK098_007279 [Nowakowskiella sp. JEL0407]KAJ3126697.1 hypothetical protein HK098_007291 [Nowakowskiella sp. JEL0407]
MDVELIISQLTLEEKASLLSGCNFWHTVPISRLNVPAIRFSDGPNGLRGTKRFGAVPSHCIPCATALSSTFDSELIHQVGAFLAKEAKRKAAHVLLAPTVNMHRSPLGGRGFECYSEDPHLGGTIAASFINGLQQNGIGATIKHFTCNDQEHERQKTDSVVDSRALREIYLRPFQIAQRDAKPWAYMTSYGRLNGIHCSENKELLQKILRDEWEFDGMVMSDWYGTYSVSESVIAGCDLEMPGPPLWRGKLVVNAVACGKVRISEIDSCVRNVLNLVKKCTEKSGIQASDPEVGVDDVEDRKFNRKVAAESMVLLKNDLGVLPFSKDVKKIAVIGPNGIIPVVSGGGSASILSHPAVSPFDGIKAAVGDSVEVIAEIGCHSHKLLPLLNSRIETPSGVSGLQVEFFNDSPETQLQPNACVNVMDCNIRFQGGIPESITVELFHVRATALFTPRESGVYEFGLAVCGRAKLYIDGKLIIDNWTKQTPGDTFVGCGTIEEIGLVQLEKGIKHKLEVLFINDMALPRRDGVSPLPAGGFRIGVCEKIDPQNAIQKAMDLAKECDHVVVVAGLNGDWESEGWDRKHMDLPGLSNELICRVLEECPKAVVVLQSGTSVNVEPFISKTHTLIHSWFPGTEGGNALADVLFGTVNPCGKLCMTFPKRIQDTPAFLNWGSENGRVVYGEGQFIGYRYYDEVEVEPRFAFGYGLSYSKFEYCNLRVSGSLTQTEKIKVTVTVKNVGTVAGYEVVQLYVSDSSCSVRRPKKELKSFAKPFLLPNESKEVDLVLDKYAVSFFDDSKQMWKVESGEFKVIVGSSSRNEDIKCVGLFSVEQSWWWKGL